MTGGSKEARRRANVFWGGYLLIVALWGAATLVVTLSSSAMFAAALGVALGCSWGVAGAWLLRADDREQAR